MGLHEFDAEGDLRPPETKPTECEAIRIHNWKERTRPTGQKDLNQNRIGGIYRTDGKSIRYPRSGTSDTDPGEPNLPQTYA